MSEVLENRLIGGVSADVEQEVDFQLTLVCELFEKEAKKFLLLQLDGLNLQKAVALHGLNRSVWSNQIFYLQVQLVGEHGALLFLCILVVPLDGGLAFLNEGAVDIVDILLHDLLKNLYPAALVDFEQSLPLAFGSELVSTLSSKPQMRHFVEHFLDVRLGLVA